MDGRRFNKCEMPDIVEMRGGYANNAPVFHSDCCAHCADVSVPTDLTCTGCGIKVHSACMSFKDGVCDVCRYAAHKLGEEPCVCCGKRLDCVDATWGDAPPGTKATYAMPGIFLYYGRTFVRAEEAPVQYAPDELDPPLWRDNPRAVVLAKNPNQVFEYDDIEGGGRRPFVVYSSAGTFVSRPCGVHSFCATAVTQIPPTDSEFTVEVTGKLADLDDSAATDPIFHDTDGKTPAAIGGLRTACTFCDEADGHLVFCLHHALNPEGCGPCAIRGLKPSEPRMKTFTKSDKPFHPFCAARAGLRRATHASGVGLVCDEGTFFNTQCLPCAPIDGSRDNSVRACARAQHPGVNSTLASERTVTLRPNHGLAPVYGDCFPEYKSVPRPPPPPPPQRTRPPQSSPPRQGDVGDLGLAPLGSCYPMQTEAEAAAAVAKVMASTAAAPDPASAPAAAPPPAAAAPASASRRRAAAAAPAPAPASAPKRRAAASSARYEEDTSDSEDESEAATPAGYESEDDDGQRTKPAAAKPARKGGRSAAKPAGGRSAAKPAGGRSAAKPAGGRSAAPKPRTPKAVKGIVKASSSKAGKSEKEKKAWVYSEICKSSSAPVPTIAEVLAELNLPRRDFKIPVKPGESEIFNSYEPEIVGEGKVKDYPPNRVAEWQYFTGYSTTDSGFFEEWPVIRCTTRDKGEPIEYEIVSGKLGKRPYSEMNPEKDVVRILGEHARHHCLKHLLQILHFMRGSGKKPPTVRECLNAKKGVFKAHKVSWNEVSVRQKFDDA